MKATVRRITFEQYNRAKENGGYIADKDMSRVFTLAELCGYGVYSAMAYKDENGYFVKAWIGSTCD